MPLSLDAWKADSGHTYPFSRVLQQQEDQYRNMAEKALGHISVPPFVVPSGTVTTSGYTVNWQPVTTTLSTSYTGPQVLASVHGMP